MFQTITARGIKIATVLILFFVCLPFSYGQESPDKAELLHVCIAYYNVENLFDTIHQSGDVDLEFTPRGSNKWDTQRYTEKLDRLAEVISRIGVELTPDGPAVVGLSEIENEQVVLDLVKQESIKDRNYQVVFIRGRDRRINNAFIYNPRYFAIEHTSSVPVLMEELEDFRTRDHLVISGQLLGEPIHFIVSHWPSRSGGERRSIPRRIAAAEAARAAIDSLKNIDPQAKVILMGDLNDDPSDVSVEKYLYTGGEIKELGEGQLYNPFMKIHRKGVGSLAYRDSWNLFDQIILSQSLLGTDLSTFKFLRAEVFNKPFLRQATGRYRDYPFRSFGGGVYLGGYSDHFPTYIFLIREVH